QRPCAWCDARRHVDALSLAVLRKKLPAIAITSISARDPEPRGLRALTTIGAEIEAATSIPAAVRAGGRRARRFSIQPTSAATPRIGRPETRLLLFGGQGGAGKTTCAAGAALAIALRPPARRVL